MLHDRTNQHIPAIAHSINVNLDCAFKKIVNQNWMFRRYPYSLTHISLKVGPVVYDLHSPPAKHIGRSHKHRIFYTARNLMCLFP